jgi:hypothetical protein
VDDPKPDTFGLPASLRVPVAARDLAAVETFVGKVLASIPGRTRPLNALKVETRYRPATPNDAAIWREPLAAAYLEALFPQHQLWVHVDYHAYRQAWSQLGMPALSEGFILDHIANRRATRARGMLHPWIRLCPISKRTNTNAGHRRGGEGMEVAYTRWLNSLAPEERAERTKAFATAVFFADPMDLTKMLDMAPGTEVLNGVRDIQHLFYDPWMRGGSARSMQARRLQRVYRLPTVDDECRARHERARIRGQ